jgi:hypothetical protein
VSVQGDYIKSPGPRNLGYNTPLESWTLQLVYPRPRPKETMKFSDPIGHQEQKLGPQRVYTRVQVQIMKKLKWS